MLLTLRQRIRSVKVLAQPWRIIKGIIKEYPISAKTLFSNKGLPYDILEIELRQEVG